MLRLLIVSIFTLSAFAGCSGSRFTEEEQHENYRMLVSPRDDEQNEYGWICEYSTVGMPPDQRVATLALVHDQQIDLLRQALRGANLEGQIYAADALLYLDGEDQVDLTTDDEEVIRRLRRSDTEVRTCGNSGSFKIYPEPAREVLSDSAVARIPEMYDMLFEYYGPR